MIVVAPNAVNDAWAGFGTNEDTLFTTVSVLANDNDTEGDSLTMDGFDITGTLRLVSNNGDGTFVYGPNGQFEHLVLGKQINDVFTYTLSDGSGGIITATVTITVNGVNDAPLLSMTIAPASLPIKTTRLPRPAC